jgi:iron complex outermembrane receptor protein
MPSHFPIRPGALRLPLLLCLIAAAWDPAALAQQDNNPLAQAEDAFGSTQGLETIGLYNSGYVRGFNPQTAGNARIDGLYFDQQAALSERIVDGSTVRIGMGVVGYAFPAPTGIVDYTLRNADLNRASGQFLSIAGPYGGWGFTLYGNTPLVPGALTLAYSGSDRVDETTGPGYTFRARSMGASPLWSPVKGLTIRAFVDWQRLTDGRTQPFFFSAGDYLPAFVGHAYLGQNWALWSTTNLNTGVIVREQLSSDWLLQFGLFRSVTDNPTGYSDLYVNVDPTGMSDHLVVGFPDQRASSTSGETRLIGTFPGDRVTQQVQLLLRGRNPVSLYGGFDVVDLGPAPIGVARQLPEPAFQYTAVTRDDTRIWNLGVAYGASVAGIGGVTVGLQREDYTKDVEDPLLGASRLSEEPWRGYGELAVPVGKSLTFYSTYAQGLEDSGVAPQSSENRGEILPASETWQLDGGLRVALTPKLKLVADAYTLDKPYFNTDLQNVERQLARQRATGVELSLAGEAAPGLNVLFGVVFDHVVLNGNDLAANGIGPLAYGQAERQATLELGYTLPSLPVLAVDAGVTYYGPSPISADSHAWCPSWLQEHVGARYVFQLASHRATLRANVLNASDQAIWTVTTNPGFSQAQGRGVQVYLSVAI